MRKSFDLLLKRIRTPEDHLPPWDWLLPVGLIVMYVIVQLVALLMISALSGENTPDAEMLVWSNLLGCVIMAVLVLQYTANALQQARDVKQIKYGVNLFEILRLTPSQNTPLWLVMFFALAIAIAADTIGFALDVPLQALPAPLDGIPLKNTLPFIGAALVIAILRPIIEEIIFRGVLQTTLLKQFPPLTAIGLSALAFAMLHYVLDPDYFWWGFVQPLVLGLTAGTVRASTKSTQAAIAAHLMFGIFVVLRAFIQ